MDGKGKTAVNELTFITENNSEWNEKIAAGLRKECETLAGIANDFKAHNIYVKSGSTFVGGIIFEHHGDILWIDSLWVEPKFRRKGIASQLLEKAMLFATQKKVKEVQLNTYFPESHTFFLSCVFKDVSIIPNWKYGLTCYLMRKEV